MPSNFRTKLPFIALALAIGTLAGCELLVDFDRTLIADDSGTDAANDGTLPNDVNVNDVVTDTTTNDVTTTDASDASTTDAADASTTDAADSSTTDADDGSTADADDGSADDGADE